MYYILYIMGNFFSSGNNENEHKIPIETPGGSTLDLNDLELNISDFRDIDLNNILQSGGKLLDEDTLEGLEFIRSNNLESDLVNKLKYGNQSGGNHTFDKYDFFKALREIEEEHGIQRGGEDTGSPIYTEEEGENIDQIKNVLLKESKELSRLTSKKHQNGGECKPCSGKLYGGRVKHPDSSTDSTTTVYSSDSSSTSSSLPMYGGNDSDSDSESKADTESKSQADSVDESISTEEGLHIYPFNTSDIKSSNNIPLNKRLLKRKI